jgi:hypothetical protein
VRLCNYWSVVAHMAAAPPQVRVSQFASLECASRSARAVRADITGLTEMKMRLLAGALLAAQVGLAAGAAQAIIAAPPKASYDFNLTGSDTISFTLSSSPQILIADPTGGSIGGQGYGYVGVDVHVDGVDYAGSEVAVYGSSGAPEDDLQIFYGNTTDTFQGPQLFNYAPEGKLAFITGAATTLSGESVVVVDPPITERLSISPAPEPSAWALMLVGVAGLGGALRRGRKALGEGSQVAA